MSPVCLATGFPGYFIMMWLLSIVWFNEATHVAFTNHVGEVWGCLWLLSLALEVGIFHLDVREMRWVRLLMVHSHSLSPGGCEGARQAVPSRL